MTHGYRIFTRSQLIVTLSSPTDHDGWAAVDVTGGPLRPAAVNNNLESWTSSYDGYGPQLTTSRDIDVIE